MSRPSPRFVRPRRRRLIACALVGVGLLGAPHAGAERADREKPIFYQGDTGGANLGSKDGELSGNVVITQGTLTIRADRIVFHQNADNSLSAVAYGNPVSFREKRDGVDEYYEGYAQRAVYDGTKRFLELFDRALLKKTNDEIRSNYISYDAGTEVFKAEGRPDSRPFGDDETPLGPRVRGVFQPQPKDAAAKDGKAPSKDDKAGKDGKLPPKSAAPVPLKADDKLSPQPGK